MFPGVGYLWVPNSMVEGFDQQREERIHEWHGSMENGCELIYDKRLFFFLHERSFFCIAEKHMHGKMMIFYSLSQTRVHKGGLGDIDRRI